MPTPSFFRPLTAEFDRLAPGQTQELVTIVAADGAKSRGVLYLPAGARPRTVTVFTHPSADLLQYWTTLDYLEAGIAVFTYTTRYVNNFTDCIHERLLLDVAGVMRFLRTEQGFEHVVLFGKSGGGSLFTYYQSQAEVPAGGRVAASPGGGGPDLNSVEMPAADGLLLLAAHPGQGRFLEKIIDPSVIDENDPVACDPQWDMYDERNGWRRPPELSSYDPQWLTAYREAQRRRVARLDAIAGERLAGAARAATLLADADGLPAEVRREAERRSQAMPLMVIHRTGANPAYCDPTIEPNDRRGGSYLSPNAHLHNYGLVGFGRVVTPAAWLSTWSGLSSNADLVKNIAAVHVPTFVVGVSADEDIYPADFERQFAAAAASDKRYAMVEGMDHALMPAKGDDVAQIRGELMNMLNAWICERFPPA